MLPEYELFVFITVHKCRPVILNSKLSTFHDVEVRALICGLLYFCFIFPFVPFSCISHWRTACEVFQGTVRLTRMPRKDAPTCLMCIWIAFNVWIKFEVVSVFFVEQVVIVCTLVWPCKITSLSVDITWIIHQVVVWIMSGKNQMVWN